MADNFDITERGQMLMKECRLGCNQRLQADSLSTFHRVYNQKNDMNQPFNDDVLAELLEKRGLKPNWKKQGNLKALFRPESFSSHTFTEYGTAEKVDEGVEWQLAVIQDALQDEFTQSFPLITANLLKIWSRCDKILTKMVYQGKFLNYDIPDPDRACVKRCLKACDTMIQEQKENGVRYSPDNGWNINIDKLAKDGVLQGWKTAFEQQFGGTTLADFQWKNVQ